MSEWVLHCAVDQHHIRRSKPTKEAALKDACAQLLRGHRIVGPNETITAERVRDWVRKTSAAQNAIFELDINLQRSERRQSAVMASYNGAAAMTNLIALKEQFPRRSPYTIPGHCEWQKAEHRGDRSGVVVSDGVEEKTSANAVTAGWSITSP
jgi:hypothetical protein